jgi:hypothetical protein
MWTSPHRLPLAQDGERVLRSTEAVETNRGRNADPASEHAIQGLDAAEALGLMLVVDARDNRDKTIGGLPPISTVRDSVNDIDVSPSTRWSGMARSQ